MTAGGSPPADSASLPVVGVEDLPPEGHTGRVTRGGSWLAAGQGVRYVLQIGLIVLLANLLTPTDYGLSALAFIVVGLGFVFTELGLTAVVVQKRDLTEDDLQSAFWVNAGTGLLMTLVVAASAPLVAAAYDEPALLHLLLWGSLIFSVQLGVVHTALLERAGRFKVLTAVDLISTLCGWAVTVTAAVLGAGPLSLLLGPLLQVALSSALVWRAARWVPRGFGTRAAYAYAWRFGRGIAGYNLVLFVSSQIDSIVVSRVAGTAVLGLYNRAYNLTRAPVEQAFFVFDRVLLPAFSRLQDERERLRAGVLRSVQTVSLLLLPGLFGIAVLAEPLVLGLLGDRWADMVPLLQLLALASAPQAVVSVLRTVFTAAGATRELFRYGLLQNGLTVLAVLIGAPWGASGVATALLLRAWLGLPWMARAPMRLLGLPWTAVLPPLARSSGCALIMSAAVLAVGRSTTDLPALTQLAVGALVGLVVYVGAASLLARSALADLRSMLPAGRGRGR